MDLFSKRVSYLHILHNDKPFKSEPQTLFDGNFTELRVVTYVSSPEFFFDRVKKFKKSYSYSWRGRIGKRVLSA